MTSVVNSGSSARKILVDWANDQDHWVRGLVGEVLSSRKPLIEEAVEHFYELLLREKELANGQPHYYAKLEDEAEVGPMEEALAITKICDVENVNALAEGQAIQFNPGLTILYGENGAGKTGYVRILKTAAAVRNAESILPNVLKPGEGKTSATISYRLGVGAEASIQWKGEQGIRPLTRVDVFDSRGILLHVDGDLTYTYTPGDLALFSIISQALEAVRKLLENDRKKRQPQGNPFTHRFSREAPLYSKIESLGPSTNLAELDRLGIVSEEEENSLRVVRERVEALHGKTTAEKLQLVREELALYRRVSAALETVDRFDASEYLETLSRRDRALERHREVTEDSLREEDIPQVLSERWRDFIEAAEAYIRESESESYPSEADVCVYCRQRLTVASRQLLEKYRAFCNNEHHAEASAAALAAQRLAKEVIGLEISHLTMDLRRRHDQLLPGEITAVLSGALEMAQEVSSLQESLRGLSPISTNSLATSIAGLRIPLENHLRHAEDLEKTISSELSERSQKLQEELPKLRMLEARITLRELLPQIREHVHDAQWADKAGLVSKRFQGMFKSLTDCSKVASEQLLNQDFETRFRKECEALKAPKVSLEFPGKKGEPARRKSIAPRYRLSEILSEGEQKVIALADFLAEAALRRSASTVIFDDPVTSLDYKRLSYVVRRIIELSRGRQVVVFTHNIWFTMEMLAYFDKEKAGCSYYDIAEDGEHRGLVTLGNSPRLDSWGDKKKRLNGLIDRIRKETEREVKEAFIEKAYEDLRGACEIVVEQDLLKRVVQSYTPNVMVGNLSAIKVMELPIAIEKISAVFDRCCRFIGSHKQPLETLNVRPTIEGLETDWRTVQDVHTSLVD